jgi:hypothetical protein
MHPRKSPHTLPEPPKDPAIQGWFQALGPPPVGRVSSALRAQVRARIAQQQAQWSLGAWLPRLVLAGVLGLSLGLNLWWGRQVLGPQVSKTRSGGALGQETAEAAQRLLTYRFQRGIEHTQGLGTFVEAHAAWREPPAIETFTPHAARTMFVRMGILYAEAYATFSSGDVEGTLQRLDLLVQTLASVQASPVLPRYLHQLRTALQNQQSPEQDIALALFEPLYDDAYAGADTREQRLLFRAGAWLENMSLAAAAGDSTALRRGGVAVEEVRSVFAALGVPQQTLAALERLQHLVMQPTLTAGDMRVIRTLTQEIQEQVSN